MTDHCEQSTPNKSSGSVKGGEFLNFASAHLVVESYCFQWSRLCEPFTFYNQYIFIPESGESLSYNGEIYYLTLT